MTLPTLDHDVHRVTSFDGTTIAARPLGDTGGAPLLVVPAVGADLSLWRNVLRRTIAHRGAVTWDLRGLHDSSVPVSDRIDPGAHAEDALAVLDGLGIERVHIAAWSTGTRIALQIAHGHPERVESLALVCGAYGYSLSTLARRFDLTGLMPPAAGVAKHFPNLVGELLRRVIARPEIAGIVRQSGVLGPTADTAPFVDVLKSISSCDTRRLLATFEAVAGDAAPEIVSEIPAPALVVAGERDRFTPFTLMEHMTDVLLHARLEVYEGATHYLPLEFPARLAEDLEAHARSGI